MNDRQTDNHVTKKGGGGNSGYSDQVDKQKIRAKEGQESWKYGK